MIGVYFSGTGNTKFCVEHLIACLEPEAKAYSIEDESVSEQIKREQEIILGYPIYFSNLPKIVKDFIIENKELWKDKKIYLVATMGLFSGDGAGVAARVLKKYGAKITGGLHLTMPDCICDEKVLKKPLEKNRAMINKSKAKIEAAANRYKEGKPTKEGLNFLYHMAGLFGQRLYFYNKTKNYTDKLKINKEKCIGCGKCAGLCPMKNITIEEKKAISHKSCTMCYRCANNCPVQAITLLGNKVVQQVTVYTTAGH